MQCKIQQLQTFRRGSIERRMRTRTHKKKGRIAKIAPVGGHNEAHREARKGTALLKMSSAKSKDVQHSRTQIKDDPDSVS